jgi:basic amino acid/polyamine antiporter, APA family
LASCFALVLGYSRIPFAAARDGNFFSIFSRVHPTKKFPHVGLLFVGVMSILCTFLDLVTVINALLATRIIVQFIGQIGAIIWLRTKAPNLNRPFRVWLYPLPLVIAFCGWLFLLATIGKTLWYAAFVVVTGAAVYLLSARKSGRWPFAAASG